MSLGLAAIILAAVGALVTGRLAWMFFRDPKAGLADATHRPEQLPQVMTNRYLSMTVLAVAAALYGDPLVIAVLFATYAFMGFSDASIYSRAGHPAIKHVAAGLAAAIVVIVALLAQFRNGAV